MQDSFQQLRFDISEKVEISSRQAGIHTLLELDLYPDVAIRYEKDQLCIEGYIRLHGTYESELPGSGQIEELAHVVPVQITVPAARAQTDRIATEIEHFDYQLLSPSLLQIEAVLLVDGLLPEGSCQSHELEEEAAEELHCAAVPVAVEEGSHSPFPDRLSARESLSHGVPHEPWQEEEPPFVPPGLIPAEKPEVSVVEERVASRYAEVSSSKEEEEGTEGAAWIHCLLADETEDFAQMRMVIVQKTDTLERLAERYGSSCEIIVRHNQLLHDEVVEGQVLYIPSSEGSAGELARKGG